MIRGADLVVAPAPQAEAAPPPEQPSAAPAPAPVALAASPAPKEFAAVPELNDALDLPPPAMIRVPRIGVD